MLVLWISLFLMSSTVNSQYSSSSSSSSQDNFASGDAVTNFQPSLAVAIGILSIMFSLTFTLLIYAKFCRRPSSSSEPHNEETLGGARRSSGIEKTVIESLPFFRFSSLKGSREGLECSVCLSKFEDVEILRLLPKCKHAFHIDCVDQWLEKQASCPLCRHTVSADDTDLTLIAYSNSLRFIRKDPSELRENSSNFELFIQREGSARFPSGRSFRKIENFDMEQSENLETEEEDDEEILHKFNHRIIVSDAMIKSRWSSVSSSDLMVLKSEMISSLSSNRFPPLDDSSSYELDKTSILIENGDQIIKIKEEMERKREFESKIEKKFPFPFDYSSSATKKGNLGEKISFSKELNSNEKRSMSEIIVHPRFTEFSQENNNRNSSLGENNVREERLRRIWLPIARRTVQWFANRERRSSQSHNTKE